MKVIPAFCIMIDNRGVSKLSEEKIREEEENCNQNCPSSCISIGNCDNCDFSDSDKDCPTD